MGTGVGGSILCGGRRLRLKDGYDMPEDPDQTMLTSPPRPRHESTTPVPRRCDMCCRSFSSAAACESHMRICPKQLARALHLAPLPLNHHPLASPPPLVRGKTESSLFPRKTRGASAARVDDASSSTGPSEEEDEDEEEEDEEDDDDGDEGREESQEEPGPLEIVDVDGEEDVVKSLSAPAVEKMNPVVDPRVEHHHTEEDDGAFFSSAAASFGGDEHEVGRLTREVDAAKERTRALEAEHERAMGALRQATTRDERGISIYEEEDPASDPAGDAGEDEAAMSATTPLSGSDGGFGAAAATRAVEAARSSDSTARSPLRKPRSSTFSKEELVEIVTAAIIAQRDVDDAAAVVEAATATRDRLRGEVVRDDDDDDDDDGDVVQAARDADLKVQIAARDLDRARARLDNVIVRLEDPRQRASVVKRIQRWAEASSSSSSSQERLLP